MLPNIFCGPKGRLWPHLLFVWQVQIIGDNDDPTFFLCGRCNIFDASGKFLFCVAGALVTRPPRSTLWPHVLFVWQVLYVRCLRSSRDLDPGVACDSTSFFVWQASEKFCWYCQRLVVTLRPFCVACAIISRPSDPTHRLGRVTNDLFVALAIPKTPSVGGSQMTPGNLNHWKHGLQRGGKFW